MQRRDTKEKESGRMAAFVKEVLSFTWDVLKIVIVVKAVWVLCMFLRKNIL